MKLTRHDIIIIRALFKLNKKQFAFLCDFSPEYISKIENGTRPISEKLEKKVIERFKLNDDILQRIKVLAQLAKQLEQEGRLKKLD
ncbi:helix-turn-helix transcriptional regulator [Geobacillus stearothermophilus]|uniref:helix-turn-helix transcriptional regulator n=1 Tax=Anoxybacillaceae TaxID=3120669 RepID=UPI002E236592|nr:helix-turn-helix transcriptional regulator [Geobacillus stearothermophilus]